MWCTPTQHHQELQQTRKDESLLSKLAFKSSDACSVKRSWSSSASRCARYVFSLHAARLLFYDVRSSPTDPLNPYSIAPIAVSTGCLLDTWLCCSGNDGGSERLGAMDTHRCGLLGLGCHQVCATAGLLVALGSACRPCKARALSLSLSLSHTLAAPYTSTLVGGCRCRESRGFAHLGSCC